MLLTVGFALAIAVGAQLSVAVPGTPVPVTAQTFVVLLGAIVLGSARATVGSLLYLGVGIAGLPWFATSGGATVGYIVGFVLAGAVLGRLADRGSVRRPFEVVAAMVLGNVIIYVCGVAVLAAVLGLNLTGAIAAGVVPFLIGDALKIALAATTIPTAWAVVHRGRV